ncbi:putative membrane protein [Sphaerotilus sulfidivorans]|jgi:putative membrane protein|uniref:Protoporphyrinogen IX oxidase n=1 Tax=Sphaerotilus sulfidivorans TaxID=639200 RepID=A0A5C1Q4I2_9BURK|nr:MULTISPECIES: CopD family protein [Sphaerotilus]MBP8175529.1 CopD family protein [Sphaerotilus sp.]MCK6403653.1 CopD family protein [Sphaerotilus sulfidivorans]NZD45218.1 CopD family protein [Sphaerotilus sulfidivorans]QEN02298.1 CopD family protein [Sphaerotilus sulfidivorans]GKQ57134.1 membrane protein [Sphaerotilus sp. FB-3]
MDTLYLGTKTLHIILVASWFAGLFYLPRILVNLAMVAPDSHAERERLLLMGRKLQRFATVLMVIALVTGLALWLGWPFWRGPGNGWVHAKLTLVVAVIGFHHMNARLLRGFERADNRRSHVWFRVYNEISVLLFAAIVALVVFKPF